MKNVIPAMLLLCCNFAIYANSDPATSAEVEDNENVVFAFGSYELYDAEDDSLISTFSGDSDITFYLDQLGSQQLLTLRAIEPASPTTQSVKFATVGNSEADWIENNAPWAYKGDASGDYTGWQFTAGTSVQFTVTYHDANNAGGTLLGTDTFTINFEQTTPPPPSFSLRINAGGPALTHNGESFTADQYAVGGSSYSNTSAQVSALYQTEHSGSARTFDYAIPLTNGDYDVKLHFAEIYWGATGGGPLGSAQRVFDVSIEGNLVLDDYDIIADVNTETPVIKTFSVTVTDGTLNLNFDGTNAAGGTDQAKVSAIEVVSASSGSGGTSPWVENGTDIYYDGGNVGIGTSSPDEKLAVNGIIHAKEVRVDLAGWPDYVFENDYELPSLEEVAEHIKQKGHLINIPSARQVEANGAYLGEMNKLLLEKV
ncbi:MAG: malectin, partial [Flavobacteriaceae bacterium]